ncbi:hypothetical protein LEN26_010210 [Aphanomyces euteiches]|nr:hypothetical protein AeMF1_017623 [Aphanomyces euteiches]KAH9122554.1 hypothetical protein LEN26_010210 [Aphanomyces euteiches]KAH9196511.1 hypothetical protein AeNC1_001535 [Aphanomyces euteiches]
MVQLNQVVPGVRKTSRGHVQITLSKRSREGTLGALQMDDLQDLYAQHKTLRPKIHAVFVAAEELTGALISHGHCDEWQVNASTGLVEYEAVADAVAALNNAMADLLNFILGEGGCTGYMVKEGGTFRTWKRRFFRLEGRSLQYFESEAPGKIAKGGGTVAGVRLNIDKPLSLDIMLELGRVLHVTCESKEDFRKWFAALSRAVPAPKRGKPVLRHMSCSVDIDDNKKSEFRPMEPSERRSASVVTLSSNSVDRIHIGVRKTSAGAVSLTFQIEDRTESTPVHDKTPKYRTMTANELRQLYVGRPAIKAAGERIFASMHILNQKLVKHGNFEVASTGLVKSSSREDAAEVAAFNAAIKAFYALMSEAPKSASMPHMPIVKLACEQDFMPSVVKIAPPVGRQLRKPVQHANTSCYACHASPIVGLRYQSTIDVDVDLCHACVGEHSTLGPFKVIARETIEHKGVACNGCRAFPIQGVRYASTTVSDFSMCQQCAASGEYNESHGPFQILTKASTPLAVMSPQPKKETIVIKQMPLVALL